MIARQIKSSDVTPIIDLGASSVAVLGSENVVDGGFLTDPTGIWTLGSGWSWDSTNHLATRAASTGAISTTVFDTPLGAIAGLSIDAGGLGYVVNDIITVSTGSADATYTVGSVSGVGAVKSLTQTTPGTAYASGAGKATTGGTGAGLVVSVLRVADAATLSQTFSAPTGNCLVTFTISGYSGNGGITCGLGATSPYYAGNGSYSLVLSAGDILTFTPTADFAGSITGVSVKAITPPAATLSLFNTNNSDGMDLRAGGIGLANAFGGYNACINGTTANSNTGFGSNVMFGNVAGNNNTALGFDALFSNAAGNSNIGVGYNALYTNTIGSFNVAVGQRALYSNTNGGNNSALGGYALNYNTTGSNNCAIGHFSMYYNTTGTDNTALGRSSLLSNSSGTMNLAIGNYSLFTNTTGSQNVAVGVYALNVNTTASNNVAIGYQALFTNTTGTSNVAIGAGALAANTTASSNTVVGRQAGKNLTTGGFNVAIGNFALLATTGTDNIAIGYSAMGSSSCTTAANNVAIGYQSGGGITTGNRNVLIGPAMISASQNQVTTGANNISIGNDVAVASATASNQLCIGNAIYGTNLSGTGATVSSSAKIGILTATPSYGLHVNTTFGFTPGTSVTPANNGDVVIEFTNNTTLTFRGKGADGTARAATLTLA